MQGKKLLSGLTAALAMAVAPLTSATSAQFLTPGSNLVIEGVPPISNELVAKVQAYTDFKPSGRSGVASVQTRHADSQTRDQFQPVALRCHTGWRGRTA